MMSNINASEDHGAIAYNQQQSYLATANINMLELTKITVQIYKHRLRETAYARL